MVSRCIAHGSENVYSIVFTIEISGISWDQLASSERHNKVGKEKFSTKAISSEQNHLTSWSIEHDK